MQARPVCPVSWLYRSAGTRLRVYYFRTLVPLRGTSFFTTKDTKVFSQWTQRPVLRIPFKGHKGRLRRVRGGLFRAGGTLPLCILS